MDPVVLLYHADELCIIYYKEEIAKQERLKIVSS